MSERLKPRNNEHEIRPEEQPFLCSVGMGSHSVNLYSKVNSFMPFFEGQGEGYLPWIPGWHVESNPTESNYSIVYSPDGSTSINYNAEEQRLYVRGPEEEFKDGQSLAYMTFWLTEAQRQADGIVTAHAASVSKDGIGILILGERGNGKTSVCLGLGRKYGYKLVANDLTMLGLNPVTGTPEIHNGTKIFGLRLSAIRDRFDELLHLFTDTSRRSQTTKAFVYPQEVGMDTESNPQVITRVYMVYIDGSKKDELSTYEMDDMWIRNYLYENFSRYVRGTAILPFSAQTQNVLGYLPSLDQEEYHSKRIELIERLIRMTKIINVSGGDLEQIINYVHTNVTGEGTE